MHSHIVSCFGCSLDNPLIILELMSERFFNCNGNN